MVPVAQPTQEGDYRLKHATRDLYFEYRPEKDRIILAPLNALSEKQKWKLNRMPGDVWQIVSKDDNSILSDRRSNLRAVRNATTTWLITVSNNASTISLSTNPQSVITALPSQELAIRNRINIDPSTVDFVFDLLAGSGPTNPITNPVGPGVSSAGGSIPGFQERFFTLTPQEAKKQSYDIIVVGTGIGGGILAGDMYDTNSKIGLNARSVLVIERGNLVFHSHCLNAARPSGLGEDRGQQNDTFFKSFRKDFKRSAASAPDWKGGPMYCLGGRSAAWGLFAPRIHDNVLRNEFPRDVADDLLTTYYEKAEALMKLSLPRTLPHHQHLIDRLNITSLPKRKVQWQWGRIASEFSYSGNFDFAEGAYSTIDKLLEIAMSKPLNDKKEEVEHQNFKMLLGLEVREVLWDQSPGKSKTAVGVRARTATGEIHDFMLNQRTDIETAVVLGAGSVDTAAILLRSKVDLRKSGGLRLTDHDIYYTQKSFRYRNPADREKTGPMKLQTFTHFDCDEVALLNISIDASTFLPRGKGRNDDLTKFIYAVILQAPLLESGHNVALDSNMEPEITITRAAHDAQTRQKKEETMREIAEQIIGTIRDVLKVDFIDGDDVGRADLKKLELGGVAHELGTVPMPSRRGGGCLDQNLKLREHERVYVCDLSVFPHSPEANPTLTLAGLSLRLSRTLVPRVRPRILSSNTVCVINHTGTWIRIFVSDSTGAVRGQQNPQVELQPGEEKEYVRGTAAEAAFVYRLQPGQINATRTYSNIPQLQVVRPGIVSPILD